MAEPASTTPSPRTLDWTANPPFSVPPRVAERKAPLLVAVVARANHLHARRPSSVPSLAALRRFRGSASQKKNPTSAFRKFPHFHSVWGPFPQFRSPFSPARTWPPPRLFRQPCAVEPGFHEVSFLGPQSSRRGDHVRLPCGALSLPPSGGTRSPGFTA